MLSTYRGVTLRQVVEDDLPFLFRLFADPCRCHLWMRTRRVFDEREFHTAWISWSTDMMAAKFIVESAGRAVGLTFDYDRTTEDGYTKITSLLQEQDVGQGVGVIATALLTDWLFEALPLRKIYLDVYGYNSAVVAMHRKAGLAEEGVLRGIRFFKGQYWDVHMFALSREAWPAIRRRLLGAPTENQRHAPAAALPAEEAAAESHPHTNGRLVRVD